MYVNTQSLSLDEAIRLKEIIFCNFLDSLYKLCKNPVYVYDMLEAVCHISGCDQLVINSVVNLYFNDFHYKVNKMEHLRLLTKSGESVRTICNNMHMSMTTYYKYKAYWETKLPPSKPLFNERQYKEIIRTLTAMEKIIERLGGF